MGKFVKLGSKANFFRDPNLDISIAKNQVVELNAVQLNAPRIKRALNGGHLIFTDKPVVEKEEEVSIEEALESLKDMINKGEKDSKIIKTFDLYTFKEIAKIMDIEVEDNDTKKTIYEAIAEEIKNM